MIAKNIFTCFLICVVLKFGNICCNNSRYCIQYKTDSNNELPLRLDSLMGQTFQVEDKGYKYSIAVCSNVSSTDYNISATQIKDDKNTVVLGRRNYTDIIGGDSWILLTYGGGDVYAANESCVGSRRVSILVSCNMDTHKPILKFVDYNSIWKSEGCFYMFELETSTICPSKTQEGLSNGSVFCIIFLTTAGVYLVVGIFYRRIVKGAKGFEQIPHHEFWIRLGNLQADGCNFVCRREDRREGSWQRLTNNFNDPQDDRDDALLRP